MSEVKVYIYDAEYECPYEYEWADYPLSPSGHMRELSERHAHMVPREQYERWAAARAAFDQVQEEMTAIVEAGRPQ